MNKRGFTLIELLTVIIVIAIIMALVFPNALKMKKNNDGKICEQYKNMMIEYAKVNEKKDEDYIDLIDLEELEEVKKYCDGYVVIDRSAQLPVYHAYISCDNGCKDDEFAEYEGGSKGVLLKANDLSMTYGDSPPSLEYTISSISSQESFTVSPLNSAVTYTIQDYQGHTVNINSSSPAGTYTIIPSATVKPNYRLTTKNGTLIINPKKCESPSNVVVGNDGTVTWTSSSNCNSSIHQVKVGNGNWEEASSGTNKKSAIISDIGERTVYVKALPPNTNYSESDSGTGTKMVYNVSLPHDSSISSVTGMGNYIDGSQATVQATANNGYNFDGWYNGTTKLSSNNPYTFTVSNETSYTPKGAGNSYTLNYVDNLFVAKAQLSYGVTVSYSDSNSYLTLDGLGTATYFIGNLWNLERRTFASEDKYQITIKYISGSYTRKKNSSESPFFVFEITNGSGSLYDDRTTAPKTYKMIELPTSGEVTDIYEIPDSRVSTATGIRYRLYQATASNIKFDDYKVQVIVTKVHSDNVTYGSNYGELDTTSKVGFTFLGWYTGLTDGNEITSESINNIIGDQTLYAHYYYHKLHIRYKSWCHNVISWCGNSGTGYSMDSSCYALKNGDRVISSYGYGQDAGYKNGLMNWNNASYICFNRSGQNGVEATDKEWKSVDTGKTYSMSDIYTAASISTSEGCDLKTVDDCMVTLKVNWMSGSGSSSSGSTCCPNGGTYYSGYCYSSGTSGLLWQECSGSGVYYVNGVCYKSRYVNSC